MKQLIHALAVFAPLLLLACGSRGDPHNMGHAAAQQLCFDCVIPRKLLDLPQLENGLFTSNGRLFVSGQFNLYEIHRDGQNYRADALLPDGTGCSGLTEDRQTLYALCAGNGGPTDFSGLYTMSLEDPSAIPEFSFSLTGMTLPNGMVAAGGRLYVTDGPIATTPKIIYLSIDPSSPNHILSQDTWLSTPLNFPNGLALSADALYVTYYQPGFGGQISRIPINPDGSPGTLENLTPRGIMDDLTVVGDTLIVTDWQNGALFQVDLGGQLLQESASNIFAQPSSVTLAGPPLFDQATVLVTERYTGDGLWALD